MENDKIYSIIKEIDYLQQLKIDKTKDACHYMIILNQLFDVMLIRDNERPIKDPFETYKRDYYYEYITTDKIKQYILRLRFTKLIKKYSKIIKLSMNDNTNTYPLNIFI